MEGSYLVHDLRKVISLVDLLRDIGLGSQLSLPKVVVLGNQSSGKSSLLQQIVGLDFLPRGAGVVTRRPLELRMNNMPELANPYAEFDEIVESGKKKRFVNFNEVRKAIDYVTDQVCGTSKQIIDKPIILNVFSKSCPNLTIVDLPGITSIPVGGQPANIYDITKQMALRYISEKRSIILCVIPANQDLSTSEALKIMREIDPKGERSIGCLTKIDIMNRGDDATKILKNQQIPLRYGYVGIKNRCQEDVANNVPVEDSLKAEKKFFTTSPIYSILSPDTFATESLTRKLTNILYQQIKSTMPEIFEEIKKKRKDAENQLEKLGPSVATTDTELVKYAWKSISTFLRIFKNSINGIKNSDYSNDPISSNVREELSNLYKEQYDDLATEELEEKDIEKAMINFPGDSTIPGFPSIDAFLALLNPLLKELQRPAYEINNRIHEIMQQESMNIVEQVMSKKFPEFNSRFSDMIRKILDKYRRELQSYMNFLLDSQLNYLYTNDINFLVGDFKRLNNEKEKNKALGNPLAYELRKRIDAYYKLVVRNLRDLIPKQVFNFLIVKCLKQLEFESFQFTGDINKLKELFNEPAEVRNRRAECIKAIKVFEESQKRIRMDPEISKLIKNSARDQKYYGRLNMKTPEQIEKEELDKRLEILAKQDAERVIEEQAKAKAQQQLNQQQNKAQQQPPVNQKQEKTVPPPTQPVAGNGPKYPPAQGARDEFSITKLFGDNAKTTVQAQPLNQGVSPQGMNGKEANNFQDFFNNPSLGAAKTDGKSPLPNGKVGTPTGSNTGLGTINPSQGLTGVGKSPEPNKGVDPAKLLGTTTGQISTNTNQPVGLGQNKPGATVQGDKGNAQGDKTNPKDAPGNPPAKTAFNKLFGL